jgi:hypothetical protein
VSLPHFRISLASVGEMTSSGATVGAPFKNLPAHRSRRALLRQCSRSYEKRKWRAVPAGNSGNQIRAALSKERPLTFFLNVFDDRGAITSSPLDEFDKAAR